MPNYRSLVTEARRLVKRSDEDQWRLAELTYIALTETHHTPDQWAREVGIGKKHAQSLKRTWERYGSKEDRLSGRTFTEHLTLATVSDERAAELLASGGNISTGYRQRQIMRKVLSNAPPKERARVVSDLLADPKVAGEVATNPRVHGALARAEAEAYRPRERAESPRRQMSEELHLVGLLYRARKAVTEALKAARDVRLDDDAAEMLLDESDRVRTALEWFDSLIESGDKSWEDALAEWEAQT